MSWSCASTHTPQVGTGIITGPGSSTIVNSATYANPAMPNALIAQGSLFTICGSNLGPSSSPSLSFPLSPTLGGTSIGVTQGSIGVAAIPVFVSGSQLNAIMPSNAPLGTVSISVSYGGQTQVVGSANIVNANFGIFTLNSAGSGPGIVTNASYALIGYNSAAHPGDNLVIWGTGLGAIATSDANAPPDEPNIMRLTRLIKEMSATTQFIVITHAKRTMEAAQALYGVTMQEPGVSKLVSVRFEPPPQVAPEPVAVMAGV
jgi:uncharacterized protein (TIGR03437 family)